MTLNELAKEIHETAVEKGWWETERNFGEQIALMHSELSEALEAWRIGTGPHYLKRDGKPEGVHVELVDCLIRILDTLYEDYADIDSLIREKMNYNKTRSYRHGGKLA